MERKRRSLIKDKKGFTGLEAAIVLTAFIVVAAVFAYMVLGAGFFSTEKAKEVVHTGVEQATSSAELCGDVIAKNASAGGNSVDSILVTLMLTAGETSMDIGEDSDTSNLTVSYADEYLYMPNVSWESSWIERRDTDDMLDYGEKVELTITIPPGSKLKSDAPDTSFILNIKPVVGAILPVNKRIPSAIEKVMVL